MNRPRNQERIQELSKQLLELTEQRNRLAKWLRQNVTHQEFMERLQRYNELCCTVASLRTRINNLRDGLQELGGSLPTSITHFHKQSTK